MKFNDDYTSEFNIWNFSRQPTFKSRESRTTPPRVDFPASLPEDFYINLTDTIGQDELQGIVDIFQDNYPNDYYLQRSSQALMDNAGIKNFTNSINYLFIRAWQFRQYALQQCREHVPIGDETIATHPCVFPVDLLLDEKRWFNYYFADQEGSYTYWPTEESFQSNRQMEQQQQQQQAQPSSSEGARRRRGRRRRTKTPARASSSTGSSSTQGGGTRRKKRRKKRTKLRKKKNRKTKRRRRKRKRTRRRR